MREQSALARFRYSDLKEAARACGGRGPYGISMELRHRLVVRWSSGRRLQMMAQAVEKLTGAEDGCDWKACRAEETAPARRGGAERLIVPKHAEFSRCGRSFHEVQVTRMGGERSWIGAVANLSTSRTESKAATERHAAGWLGSRSAGCGRSLAEAGGAGSGARTPQSRVSSSTAYCRARSRASER